MTSTEETRGRQGGDIPDHIAENVAGQNIVVDLRISQLLDTAAKLFERAVGQPSAIAEESAYLAQELQKVVNGQSSWAPPRHDKRFNDPAWTENTFYKNLLQGYMAWSQSLQNFALKAGLEPKETGRARFLLSQISEALAPTNFLMSNPAALKAAIDSGGKTLLDGYQNFLKDAAERRPIPSQVDFRSFKVGENLAVTPGECSSLSSMLLRPSRSGSVQSSSFPPSSTSITRSILPRGGASSNISSKPGSPCSPWCFAIPSPSTTIGAWKPTSAYIEATDAAFRTVREISGVEDPHTIAVCGAAPVVVSLAGYYAARSQRNIGSMTLFVAPLDTSGMADTPGLGDFVDPKLNEVVKRWPNTKDRVSADELTLLFAMLRPNDLIWNYWVNNYLLGKQPAAFDVLYWNADGTGMTAQFNRDFRKFVEENPLTRAGAMTVKGTHIADISKFDFDSFVIGAATDHICPWPTAYRSAQMLGERSQFVLGGSGHIQTIVSPPDNPKASYFTNPDKSMPPEEWLRKAHKTTGTWWGRFSKWCSERSGPMVAAPSAPGSARHPSLCKAPGTYVFEKVPQSGTGTLW